MKPIIEAHVDFDSRLPIRIVTPEGCIPLTLKETKAFIHELVTVANIVDHREESERKTREIFMMKEIKNAA